MRNQEERPTPLPPAPEPDPMHDPPLEPPAPPGPMPDPGVPNLPSYEDEPPVSPTDGER